MAGAESTLKVTGDVDDLISSLNALSETIDNLTDKIVNIGVEADTTELEEAQDKLNAYDDSIATADLKVDDEASPTITELEEEITKIDNMTATADLMANDNLSRVVDEAVNDLTNIDNMVASPTLTADDQLTLITTNAEAELSYIDGLTASATITVDDVSTGVISSIENDLESIDGTVATATATVEDNASSILDEIEGKVSELDGNDINLKISLDGAEEVETQLEEIEGRAGTLEETLLGIGSTIAGSEVEKTLLSTNKALQKAALYGGDTADAYQRMYEQARKIYTAKYGIQDVANAMLLLTKATGSTNATLQLMPNIMDYVKVADADLTLATKTAADIMQKYGLSAEQAGHAMRYMAAASTQTKMSGDELATLVDRLSGDFTALGLSVEDATDLIWAFDRSGVRSNEIMRALRSGFRYFLNAMDESSPSFEKVTKALEELGISVYDANGNLRPAGELAMEAADKLSKMENSTRKSQLAMDIFGPSAKDTFGILKVSPAEAANAYGKSADKIVDSTKEINAANLSMEEKTKKFFDWLISYIPSSLATLAVILASGLTAIFGIIPGILGYIDKIWGTGLQKTWIDKTRLAISKLRSVGRGFLEVIKSWMGWGDEAGKAGANVAKRLTGEIKPEGPLAKITEFGKKIMSRLKIVFNTEEIIPSIKGFWSRIVLAFKNAISPVHFDEAGNIVANGVDKVGRRFSSPGILSRVFSSGRNLISTFVNGLKSVKIAPEIVTGPLSRLVAGIRGISLPATLRGAGSLIKGIGSIGSAIWALEDISRWVNAVVSEHDWGSKKANEAADSYVRLTDTWKYNIPVVSEIIGAFDVLSFTIDNLLSGKGWDSFGLALDQWHGYVKTHANATQKDLDNIESMWREKFGTDIPAILKTFGPLTAVDLKNSTDNIKATTNKWADDVRVKFGEFSNWVKSGFDFKNIKFPDLGAEATKMIDSVLFALGFGLGKIAKTILNLPQIISGAWNNTKKAFTDFIAWLPTIGASLKAGAVNAWNNLIAGFKSVYSQLMSIITNPQRALNNLYNWLISGKDKLLKAAQGLWSSLVNGFKGLQGQVGSAINYVPTKIKSFISWLGTIPGQLYKMASNAWTGFVNGVKSTYSQIKNAIDGAIKKIKDGLKWLMDLPKNAWDWGYNLIKSWWDGLVKWVTENLDNAKKWLMDRLNAFTRGLQAASPPKEGPLKNIDKWGYNLADAYIEGFQRGILNIYGAMKTVTGQISSILSSKSLEISPHVNPENFAVNREVSNNIITYSTPKEPKIDINVNMDLGGIKVSNVEEGREVANTIVETVITKLKDELRGKGMSTYTIGV